MERKKNTHLLPFQTDNAHTGIKPVGSNSMEHGAVSLLVCYFFTKPVYTYIYFIFFLLLISSVS